jgi:hypothetical protein
MGKAIWPVRRRYPGRPMGTGLGKNVRLASFFALLLAALTLVSCGGGSDSDTDGGEQALTGKEVAAAYEEAAGGYPFEKEVTLVEGAVAYGPKDAADPTELEPLNKALGESSLLWQVLVFEGPQAPTGTEAAKAAAFASRSFDEAAPGVFIGDSDIAYVPRDNVVVTGPALDGDPEEPTLTRWKAVLDSL